MLVFKNKTSGNYFFVDNQKGTITFLRPKEYSVLHKFQSFIGTIDHLTLPDLKTVNRFRSILKKGILKDVPLDDTKQFILSNYPEYFI